MGNSSGVIIPKTMLMELGASAGDAVDISVSDGRIVLSRVARHPRDGWEEAARAIAEAAYEGGKPLN
jgi:antitoxin MazE